MSAFYQVSIWFVADTELIYSTLKTIYMAGTETQPVETPTVETTQNEDSNHNYKTVEEFISDMRLMLNNAKANPAILTKIQAAGYTEADIDGKLSDLDLLQTYNENQATEYGEQYAATEAWQQWRADNHANYIDHIELARIAFRKDAAAQKALALNGRRSEGQANYILQGFQFYNNALGSTAFKTALAKKGIVELDLEGGKIAFENLQKVRESQQKETGEAQRATQLRDECYDDLAEWLVDFRATAKVVLRTLPQLMEELGIKQTV